MLATTGSKDIENQYASGPADSGRKSYNKVIDIWSRAKTRSLGHDGSRLAKKAVSTGAVHATSVDGENGEPVHAGVFQLRVHDGRNSGARGSAAQIRQLAGMRV